MNVQTLGRYTLIRKLATGGMAEVFLARVEGPGGFAKRLVVKRILPQFCEDERFVSMFLSEATLAAQLNHPNLVQIFDFGEASGQYYLAMEFIDGPNLRVLAQRAREFGTPLSNATCARIVSMAAEGLKYAHDLKDDQGRPVNLVHRDISPDNILVSRSGSVKVVDFGIAKTDTQMHHTRSGVIKGKMAYMPPEQLSRQPLDRRADVYALGVVLYELLSGAFPFDATSEVSIIQAVMNQEPLMPISQRVPAIPRDLEAIITCCLAKAREARFSDCAELQRALEKFIQGSGESVVPSDIAATVDSFFPLRPESETIELPASKMPTEDEIAPTVSKNSDVIEKIRSNGAQPAPVSVQPGAPVSSDAASHLSMSRTDMSVVTGASKSKGPMIAVGVGAVLVIAAIAFAMWPASAPKAPIVVTAPVGVVDAGSKEAAPSRVDAGGQTASAAVVDAGATDVSPDAGVEPSTVSAVVDAGPKPVAVAKVARLEIRIRPYADAVYLDGKNLGETPVAPVSVSIGSHKLRLVNTKGAKDVVVNIVVPAGGLTFTRNLNDSE